MAEYIRAGPITLPHYIRGSFRSFLHCTSYSHQSNGDAESGFSYSFWRPLPRSTKQRVMGIQGLYTKLRPYGEPVTFAADGTDRISGGLVIDGPAFAFWLYSRAYLEAHAEARSAPRCAIPSYKLLATHALQWLRTFERHGLRIKHILFDGTLPDFKLGTRLQRMQRSINDLRVLKRSAEDFSVDVTSALNKDVEGAQSVIALRPPGVVPPFIVAVVLETLLDGPFSERVAVLPGEADAACVHQVYSDSSDIILTGDTDLVVHNPQSRVAFLADLDYHGGERGSADLTLLVYNTMKLSELLGAKSLLKLAYVMHNDYRIGLIDAAALANEMDVSTALHQQTYQSFAEQYELPDVIWSLQNPGLDALLKRLDPRVTEPIFQVLFPGSKARNVRLNLPRLLEDPDRVSASSASRDICDLALSVLATLAKFPHNYFVIERKAEKAEIIRVNVLQGEELHYALVFWRSSLTKLFAEHLKWVVGDIWKIFALQHVLKWTADSGRTLPHQDDVLRLCQGSQRICSWRELHLAAQVEGVLNSLRILNQILQLRFAVRAGETGDSAFDTAVMDMSRTLKTLPPIVELMSFPCAVLRIDVSEDRLRRAIGAIYPEFTEFATDRKQKRRRRREIIQKDQETSAAPASSGNRFALLDAT